MESRIDGCNLATEQQQGNGESQLEIGEEESKFMIFIPPVVSIQEGAILFPLLLFSIVSLPACLFVSASNLFNPLQCSCLENSRDRGAWWASVYGVAQSRTRLK